MIKKTTLALSLSLFIVGCSDPKIDASSAEAYSQSIQKIVASLPEDQRQRFQQDLILVALKDVSFEGVLTDGKLSIDSSLQKSKDGLNGKTAKDIMEAADLLRAEQAQKEKQQAAAEIKELLQEKEKADQAKVELSNFQVIRSRFYKESDRYSYSPKPIIELTVKNNTKHPISRAYFKGIIASPGRSIQWLVETFNYQIDGGLEPGETAKWTLSPNMFSDWGTVDAPADAVFTVETYRLDGANDAVLFDAEGLSEYKLERLAELQKKYGSG